MSIQFRKYHGTGNDFIMIDDRDRHFPEADTTLIAHMCHRHFGIGADGLILLQHTAGYDFKMVYFNADGRESTMCGNGGRCIVQFAQHLGIIKNRASFLAIDGPHAATIENNLISLGMNDVNHIDQKEDFLTLDTGSPHYVEFMNQLPKTKSFFRKAQAIRLSPPFKTEGINVNFASIDGENIEIKTYERGVEDETLSCGTGATATAIAAHFAGKIKSCVVPIKVAGGDLKVTFSEKNGCYHDVRLIGPATFVFKGEYQ